MAAEATELASGKLLRDQPAHDARVHGDRHHDGHEGRGEHAVYDGTPIKRPDGVERCEVQRCPGQCGDRNRGVECFGLSGAAIEAFRPAKDFASLRYSSLDQINTTNVKDLKVAWTFSTGLDRGHEAAPLVVGNTMYVASTYGEIIALNATTGAELSRRTSTVRPLGRTVRRTVAGSSAAVRSEMVMVPR